MGRLERRVRKSEETVESAGGDAAVSRLPDEDVFLLVDAIRKAEAADQPGVPSPRLTDEEAEAQARFFALREEACRTGWAGGASASSDIRSGESRS